MINSSIAGMCVRQARKADLDELAGLLQQLFTIEEDFRFDAARQHRGLEMLLDRDGAVVLVAEKENNVIGMCTGQLMISTAEGGHSLLVEDVVVDEQWRGRGIGTGLLKALEDWGEKKKVSRYQLLADKSNDAGIRFYRKHNWQQTELICLRKHPLMGTSKGKG
ncbi:acetyltransferase [Desulfocapsa sulfexigens DSM 10523]|uniref:Acetyltransferase n=1 Tax=Desulfocapsa sulfexigens (strain DSM 10523 / SB164P1) TaxID=1167006 RepID=M1P5H1_DESSD|nr:GNAT family N-acetyltransferase [Desulfocapsa sulfexigens]AGF76927.1 acetyltransferase [Desulfocapsa sulfexigens DSM 10523]